MSVDHRVMVHYSGGCFDSFDSSLQGRVVELIPSVSTKRTGVSIVCKLDLNVFRRICARHYGAASGC